VLERRKASLANLSDVPSFVDQEHHTAPLTGGRHPFGLLYPLAASSALAVGPSQPGAHADGRTGRSTDDSGNIFRHRSHCLLEDRQRRLAQPPGQRGGESDLARWELDELPTAERAGGNQLGDERIRGRSDRLEEIESRARRIRSIDVRPAELGIQAESAKGELRLELTPRIRERLKRTTEDIVTVGSDLIRAKELLGHGSFGAWLER
jgi:hypothetical protein